jgi:hypothetical protein
MSAETDLLTAIYERLNGADAHGTPLTVGGNRVPAYTGEAPTDAQADYVVIERPRNRPDETIDKQVQHRIRQQIRVHTAYESGKGNYFQGYQIAEAVHDLIRAAPITVSSDEVYFPEPNKQPVPSYSKGPQSAYDITMRYQVLI